MPSVRRSRHDITAGVPAGPTRTGNGSSCVAATGTTSISARLYARRRSAGDIANTEPPGTASSSHAGSPESTTTPCSSVTKASFTVRLRSMFGTSIFTTAAPSKRPPAWIGAE